MALSLDLRARIITAYKNQEGSVRTLAQRFCVSPSTVWSLLQQIKKTGHYEPVSPPGRPSAVDSKGVVLIINWVKQKNDWTLSELCQVYEKETGVAFSIMTMHRTCKKLNLSYKKNKTRRRATTGRYSRSAARV